MIKRWWCAASLETVLEMIPEEYHETAEKLYTLQLYRRTVKDAVGEKTKLNGVRAIMFSNGVNKRTIEEVAAYMDTTQKRVKKHPTQAQDLHELLCMLVRGSVDERHIIKYGYDMMTDEHKKMFTCKVMLKNHKDFNKVMYIMNELYFRHDKTPGAHKAFKNEIGPYLYQDLTGKQYEGQLDDFFTADTEEAEEEVELHKILVELRKKQ